jgi:hypothetical protein
MARKKLLLGAILFFLGLIGIASLLTVEIALPPEIQATLEAQFTPQQIRFLTLINPTIILLVAVIAGTFLYGLAGLKVPLIERISGITQEAVNFPDILKYGVIGGVVTGILLVLIGLIFNPLLPAEFQELSEKISPTLAARFLYGGITEEILMRFGLMTFIVFMASKIVKGTPPKVYWTGIIIAAIVFALGHFPIAFQVTGQPSPTLMLYLLIGNASGGIIFGWLYWKKGLESAFMAHIFAHVVMVLAEPMIS